MPTAAKVHLQPIEAANHFFIGLQSIPKTAGHMARWGRTKAHTTKQQYSAAIANAAQASRSLLFCVIGYPLRISPQRRTKGERKLAREMERTGFPCFPPFYPENNRIPA
ncbi:MAG: hypothetical protein U0793_31310 [Gemmataceae bacterium]